MKLSKAIKILKRHNEWRRDTENEIIMPHPFEIGEAIDTIIKHYENKRRNTD